MAVSSASVSGFRSLRLISVILSDCPFNPDFGIFSRRFKWRASGVSGIERLRHEAAEEEKGKRTPRSQSRTNPGSRTIRLKILHFSNLEDIHSESCQD